jgi:hypothetical protein
MNNREIDRLDLLTSGTLSARALRALPDFRLLRVFENHESV